MKKPQQPQPRSSVAISIALHVVLGLVLVRFLTFGSLNLFDDGTAPVERIGFVALPQDGPPSPGVSGGDDRPERPRTAPPPLVAPSAVPTGVPVLPAEPAAPREEEEGGSGPLVGRGGPLAGIRPSYSEPRVWVPPAPLVTAPKTMTERVDSALSARIAQHEDSLRLTAAARKAPGDWTWERGGKKYGWDQKGIRLGDFTIPSALLPTLAANTALNPAAQQRAELERLAREVREQGQRNMTEDEFRKAVNSIRERKERERRDAEAMTARGGTLQR